MSSKKTTEIKIKEHENRLYSYTRDHIRRLEEHFPGISEMDFWSYRKDLPETFPEDLHNRTQGEVSKSRD